MGRVFFKNYFLFIYTILGIRSYFASIYVSTELGKSWHQGIKLE